MSAATMLTVKVPTSVETDCLLNPAPGGVLLTGAGNAVGFTVGLTDGFGVGDFIGLGLGEGDSLGDGDASAVGVGLAWVLNRIFGLVIKT
ncbi:hypothetical protein HYZ78_03925, partial [Candidatus Microgenomates bacterium]|nr:hypothetical protein [Candidatus Microgenomates bacterium]